MTCIWFRDFDLSAKKLAAEFKNFIKTNNNEYCEKLKNFLNDGFKSYYEEINKKLQDELLSNESKENNLQKMVDGSFKEIENFEKYVLKIN